MTDKLDRIDLQILRDLQENGRLTNVELAKRAGISPPPCLRRLKSLEDAGIIRGYHADIAPEIFGFNVLIFSEVSLTSQNDADLKSFEEKVKEWSFVRECYLITGESDFLLKIVAQSFDDYQHFMTKELAKIGNVARIRTSMVLKKIKSEHGIPIETSL